MAKDAKATIKKTDDSLVDVVILAAAAESEHYEIAVYDTLITNADARGATEVVALLQRNRDEEKHALQLARTTMKTIAQRGHRSPRHQLTETPRDARHQRRAPRTGDGCHYAITRAGLLVASSQCVMLRLRRAC